MTVTTGTFGGRRAKLAFLSGHPELVAVAAVLAAWVLLLVFAARAAGGGTSAAMPGMPMPATSGGPWAAALTALPSWLLMTVAMMGPAAVAKFRDLVRAGTASPRAMAAFSVAYLAVWAAFGLLAEAAATAIHGLPSPRALALVLLAATAWQLTPLKHRVLFACRGEGAAAAEPSAAPANAAPAAGRCASHQPAAVAMALRSGLVFGLCCLGTCWCLMLIPLAAPGGQLPWMAGLTILISAERLASAGRDAGRGADLRSASRAVALTTAGTLAVAAVATLAVSGLLQ